MIYLLVSNFDTSEILICLRVVDYYCLSHCHRNFSCCCILTFDPGKYAIPKWCTGRKWNFPMASHRKKSRRLDLADEMGQGKKKIPWYTHRLMHRKRVTRELHDSYFRLMTIKHAIPKIEWAIECAIDWALNYYITQSRLEVKVGVIDKVW